jgi:cytochrome b561
MPVENILQEVNQIATLAGILAGFAFSAVVQLLASDRPGKLPTITIVIFTLSTLMFLFTIFAFVMIGAATAELNQEIKELDSLGGWAFMIAFFGLILFLFGVGLTGWIRSTVTGIATSIFSLLTFCLSLWVFASVISIFI